jgi:hypothetical protein
MSFIFVFLVLYIVSCSSPRAPISSLGHLGLALLLLVCGNDDRKVVVPLK